MVSSCSFREGVGYAPIFQANENESDREFFQRITALFKEKLGIGSDRVFQKIWDQSVAVQRIQWNGGQPLSLEAFQEIEAGLKETLVYHGPGIKTEGKGSNPDIHEVLQYLLGNQESSKAWKNEKNIKALLFQKDPDLLKAVRNEFRIILQSCSDQLPVSGTKEEVLFQAFVGNILSLLPYSYPEAGEVFSIPSKVNGEWKNINYKIDEKIHLTPDWFSSPIVAYGLTSSEGPPLLIFLGTTYPAGEGFIATLLSDFTPCLSVGHAPYLFGKKNIEKWMKDKSGVHLYGVSLGGALAFQVLRHHEGKIAQVDTFNPPGLYPWNWKGIDNVDVQIFYQENDLVATMGSFPEGSRVNVYRVIPEKGENLFKAHARVYTGCKSVTLLKSDPSYENSRISRKLLTALHLVLGFVLAFIPILCAYLLYVFFDLFLIRPIAIAQKRIS